MNYADFAKSAYHDVAPTGYQVDSELSGPDRRIYHQDGKNVVVAFRGTNLNNTRDIGANAAMGFHVQGFTNRFKNSLDVTKRAVKKYGLENVSVTGHSMGGSQAVYVANKLNLGGAAYNPYTSWSNKNTSDKFKVHIAVGDPVSSPGMFIPGQKNITYHAPKASFWKDAGGYAAVTAINNNEKLAAVKKIPGYEAYAKNSTGFGLVKNLHDIDHYTSPDLKTYHTHYSNPSIEPNHEKSFQDPSTARRVNYSETPARRGPLSTTQSLRSSRRKGR